jgi:Zn-finger domain-containing protein
MANLKKIDGRSLQRTGRTKQLNLKVRESFYKLVYQLAKEENCLITELVEKTVLEYQKKKNKKPNIISNTIERERESKNGQNLRKTKADTSQTKK